MKSVRLFLAVIISFFIICCFFSAAADDIQLTQEEKDFITSHPEIHLGVDPKFMPYEFIDSDGEYKGIASEYIDLICKKTGLQMVVEKKLTWPQAYEKAVQRELDVLPCVAKTKEREPYFLFSAPYYSFQRVLFINENNSDIRKFDDVMYKKVAVQKDSSHQGFLKQYSSIELSKYKDVDEALAAVSRGDEIAFVGNLATSVYLAKTNGITNLKYINIESEDKQYLYFAVRSDWPELVSIINKGLSNITEEEKISINNKWLGVEEKYDFGWIIRIIEIIGTVVAIILIVSFYWIMKLKKEIKLRKKIEKELEIAKNEAETANRIKSTFLARMSHEIRTPLNAITGMTYLIKKTDVTVTQKLYLDKIAQASRNMLGIINDILDFSKIEAGKIELEIIPFNLDKVLQQVIDIVSFRVDEQGIDFFMNKDPDLPVFFMGDPTRIEQILINVINNAVKFTKDGEVSVSVQACARENNRYKIGFKVKDTGIGMSESQIGQLFRPFDQGDSSITRRFGGTGLGLSIVKSLVEMMDGEINVESVSGEGSVFDIQIALEVDMVREYENKKVSESISFPDIRTLVVEKSNTYLNLLKDYLHAFSLEADFASSESMAIQLLEEGKDKGKIQYNLLIVDYDTPESGGIDFIHRIKQLSIFDEPPKSILIIPLVREDLFEKLESEEIDFGITKPIIPSILYNGIVELFKTKVLEFYEPSDHVKKHAFTAEYPYHILVVEDNKTNQFIAKSILEQSGFKVSLADDGKQGYDFFVENQDDLDLILMDLHMPVMNGLDSASMIRGVNAIIPIIAMTADAITGVEDKCRSVGMDHYVSKPFEPEHFVDTIWKVIKSTHESEKNEMDIEDVKEENMSLDAAPVLDETDGIRRIGGNKELYNLVLQQYYLENKEIPSLLSDKIDNKDYAEAVQIVHKIKSSSGNIGAKNLVSIASDLQKKLGTSDVSEILLLHEEFQSLLKRLLVEIESKINI